MVPVAGGYYLSSGADIRPDTTSQGMNLKGHTTYRSFADGSIFPGYKADWLKTLLDAGVWLNLVLELKHYGAANQNAQSFSVGGVKYSVPAPNMTIQQKAGTVFPKAYGYAQVLSGQCDGLLARALAQLKTVTGKVNIQLASELDTDHEFGITEAGVSYTWEQADKLALAAMSYIISYFKRNGLPEHITFTVGCAGFDRASFKRLHSEEIMSVVDYVQWNAYRRTSSLTAYDLFNRTKSWLATDLGPTAKLKDVIIAEWGTLASLKDQAAFIATAPEAIQRLNAGTVSNKIVMMNYFNSGWGKLDPKAAGTTALKNIYDQAPYRLDSQAKKR